MTNNQILEPQRVSLRLRMSPRAGQDRLDGGWWPQSRDLSVEFADLVDHFPPASGRIVRAGYSPPNWDTPARRIAVAGGYVKVGSFPRDDTHLIRLTTSDRTVLYVLVVPPPGMTQEQGEGALRAAASPGNATDAASLLEAVTTSYTTLLDSTPEGDPKGHWDDDGGSWRAQDGGPPWLRDGD
jgi:hypothetical protein